MLVGYGCGARGSVGEIGQLRQGDAVIVTVIAREQSPAASDNREAYTATQGAVACAGDGGGGLFEPLDQRGERPTLLGVLSRSDRQQISYSATVSAQTFLNFAKRWSDENNRAVCGLDADPTTCELPSITVSSPPGPSTISTPIIANVFYKAGERVQNIVSRVCGPQDPAYYEVLKTYHEQATGWDITPKTQFGSDGEIDLPPCAKITPTQVKRVTIKKGDTPRKLFDRESDKSQWKTFAASGFATVDTSSFMTAYTALNPSLNINLPLTPGMAVAVPVIPVSPKNLPVAGATPRLNEPRAELAKTDAELQSGQDCLGSDRDDYPYNMTALLDVLASNRAASSNERATVTVLIGDNGLFLSKLGAFGDPILKTTEEEHGHLDVYHEAITPIQAGSNQSHGTQVASLALGGPVLARLFGLTGNMRIKIRPVRLFYEKTVESLETKTGKLTTIEQYTIDPAAIASLVDDASSNKAQIVNLSLKYYQDMPEIKKAIEERGFALYVVAAGNDDGPLSATNTVYPAMYGGKIHDGLSNIIAVGALDGDLELAKISNSGPQWVDIGAPGCAIPVLSYDNNKKLWNIQKLHGTSLAAPIVSFAAALIKSKSGNWSPALIKGRLLASADLSPALVSKSRTHAS